MGVRRRDRRGTEVRASLTARYEAAVKRHPEFMYAGHPWMLMLAKLRAGEPVVVPTWLVADFIAGPVHEAPSQFVRVDPDGTLTFTEL